MTPNRFSRDMSALIAQYRDAAALGKAGRLLVEQALGLGAPAYLPGIGAFLERVRELERVTDRPAHGPTRYDGDTHL